MYNIHAAAKEGKEYIIANQSNISKLFNLIRRQVNL